MSFDSANKSRGRGPRSLEEKSRKGLTYFSEEEARNALKFAQRFSTPTPTKFVPVPDVFDSVGDYCDVMANNHFADYCCMFWGAKSPASLQRADKVCLKIKTSYIDRDTGEEEGSVLVLGRRDRFPSEGTNQHLVEISGSFHVVFKQLRQPEEQSIVVTPKIDKKIGSYVNCRFIGYIGSFMSNIRGVLALSNTSEPDLPILQSIVNPKAKIPGSYLNTRIPRDERFCNSFQRKAVESLQYAQEVIVGPPGTGKSTTVRLIEKYKVPKGEILLATTTRNKALDSIAEKLENRNICVIGNEARIGDFAKKFLLDNLVENHEDVLKWKKICRDISADVLELEMKIDEIQDAWRAEICPGTLVDASFSYADGDKWEKARVESRYRTSDSEFYVESLESLSRDIFDRDSDFLDKHRTHTTGSVYDDALRDLGNLEITDSEKKLDKYVEDLKELKKEKDISTLKRNRLSVKVREEIITNTHVILCTIASIWKVSMVFENVKIHTAVVDEAACTDEISVSLILKMSPKNIIHIGDHKQLPPLVHTADTSNTKYDRSLMERVIDATSISHQLNIQYRMHPDICSLVSELSYSEVLETSKRTKRKRRREGALVWRHTKGKEDKVGTSYKNVKEVEACEDLYQQEREYEPHQTIMIISFYKPQYRMMEHFFKGHLRKDPNLKLVTVDAAQGSEADCVIMSCVRTNRERRIGFLSDKRRLNVAISRAKQVLYVVGDRDTFKDSRFDYWRTLADRCRVWSYQ